MMFARRRHLRAIFFVYLLTFFLTRTTHAEGIIATQKGKVYHTHPVECASARKINDENKVTFATREEAEGSGRRLCKRCETLDRKSPDTTKPAKPAATRQTASRTNENTTRQPTSAPADVSTTDAIPEYAKVNQVLPGGTIDLDNGEKARLFGVICPGKGQPMCNDAERFIAEQTRGRNVRVAMDASPCCPMPRDHLGRLIVFLTPEPGGRDLGGEMIFQGYAWLDRTACFARRPEYARHEEEAWRAGRGIWEKLSGSAGEQEVVVGRYADEFHSPKCPHVKHLTSPQKMSINEAKSRRRVPCSEFRSDS